MPRNEFLTDMLAADLPSRFIAKLLSELPIIYAEAFARAYDDPSWGKREGDYMLGHTRRSLYEQASRAAAEASGIRVQQHIPKRGNVSHVRVLAGRFVLVGSHVATPGGFPVHSDCRKQFAEINQHLEQGDLFTIESKPGEHSLYAFITHTSVPGAPNQFRSAQVGFPNTSFDGWLQDPIDLRDILDAQTQLENSIDQNTLQSTVPMPVWKSNIKRAGEGEK
ncbi:MAG: hypothetical protein AAF098_10435 [Pseudomonadota bacterium]